VRQEKEPVAFSKKKAAHKDQRESKVLERESFPMSRKAQKREESKKPAAKKSHLPGKKTQKIENKYGISSSGKKKNSL